MTVRRRYAGLVIGLTLAASACGGKREKTTGSVRFAPNGIFNVAEASLPGAARIKIFAERYAFRGRSYSELAYGVEASGSHRLTEGATGPSMRSAEQSVLRLVVAHGCVGQTSYTLALGILRDAADVVSAQQDRKTIRFKQLAIPARFHPEGVAVYAVLGKGAIDVAARTAVGRHLVYREVYGRPDVPVCQSVTRKR